MLTNVVLRFIFSLCESSNEDITNYRDQLENIDEYKLWKTHFRNMVSSSSGTPYVPYFVQVSQQNKGGTFTLRNCTEVDLWIVGC